MTLSAIAVTSFLLGLSGAMMPGPLLTVTISESVRRGAWAGPVLIAGHALLEGTLILALLFGLDKILQAPLAFAVISFAGGLILVWMGRGMLRTLPQLTLDLRPAQETGLHPVVAGVMVSVANPYFTLWWATVGLGYLLIAEEVGRTGVAVFYVFHVLSDLVWYSLISGTATFGRRFLNDRAYRLLVGSCALFIISFGFYFIYRGIENISNLS